MGGGIVAIAGFAFWGGTGSGAQRWPETALQGLRLEYLEVIAEGCSYGDADVISAPSGALYVAFREGAPCAGLERGCAISYKVRPQSQWAEQERVTAELFTARHRLGLAGAEVLLVWLEQDWEWVHRLKAALCPPHGPPEVSTLLDTSTITPLAVAWAGKTLYVVASDWRPGRTGTKIFRKNEGEPFLSVPFPWERTLLDTGGLTCEKDGTIHLPGEIGGNLCYLLSPDGGQTWNLKKLPQFHPPVNKPKNALVDKLRLLVWLESSSGGLFADRLVAASSRDGEAWSSPTVLAASSPQQVILEPELVTGKRSPLLVFWSQGDFFAPAMRCYYSVFDGQSWSGPFVFAPDSAVDISTPRGRIDPTSQLVHLSYSALYPSGRDVVWYATARLTTAPVELPEHQVAPRPLALGAPYPNPFNAVVSVPFQVPTGAACVLELCDISGRTVRVIWRGLGSGERQLAHWDGHTAAGGVAPSGVYLLRLVAEGTEATRKVVLVR